ncbi:MAG TPA: hypothetical protein VE244_08450 [Nitrososphaeraceae archaeon]|nr:hypothetical protein [Nitrososphaeraceae archaeon]
MKSQFRSSLKLSPCHYQTNGFIILYVNYLGVVESSFRDITYKQQRQQQQECQT